MKLIVVNEIPKRHRKPRSTLYNVLEEFMAMDAKIVKIDPIREGYKTVVGGSSAFGKAIKRYGYPINRFQRGNWIYLEKISTEGP